MMLPSNPGPIGIFDSGYGGLTILHGLTAWWRMGNISTNKWEKAIIPALTKTEAADSTNLIISVIS